MTTTHWQRLLRAKVARWNRRQGFTTGWHRLEAVLATIPGRTA